MIGADGIGQPDVVEAPLQLHRRSGDVELDVPVAETGDHFAKGDLRTRIDVADERRVEDHVPHGLRSAVDSGPESALEEMGVGEEHPVLDAVHDHPGHHASIEVVADIDVSVFVGGPPEYRVRRPSGPPDHIGDRQDDGRDDRLQDTDRDDEDRRDGRDPDLRPTRVGE